MKKLASEAASEMKNAMTSFHNETSKALWTSIMLRKKHPNPQKIIVVKSSNPTPPKDGIELTPFDVWESRFPLPLVLIYQPGRAPSVETLVEGLEKLLAIYPSLGGRVRLEGGWGKDKAVVRFDKYIPGTASRGRCKLILGPVEDEKGYRNSDWERGLFQEKWIGSVAVGLPIVTGKALFEVRLTPFANGGAALSACASHGLVDMQSMAQVMTDLAKLCRKEEVADHHDESLDYVMLRKNLVLPDSIRTHHSNRDPEGTEIPGFVEKMYMNMVKEMLPTAIAKTEVRSFTFTRADVLALKAVVQGGRAWKCFQEKGYRLSAHDVITAIIWQSLAAVHPYHPQQDWGLVVIVNWRGKSHRIPLNYFGNATISPKTSRTMKELLHEMDLSECALIVRELGNVSAEEVEHLIVRKNQIQHGDGSQGEQGSSDIDRLINLSANANDGGCGVFISNFSKFDLYDVDFGDGRPDVVRFPHPPLPGFCYAYNSADGGSDINVVVTVFEEDSKRLFGIDCVEGRPIIDGEQIIPKAETFQNNVAQKIDQAQFEEGVELLYFNKGRTQFAVGGEVDPKEKEVMPKP